MSPVHKIVFHGLRYPKLIGKLTFASALTIASHAHSASISMYSTAPEVAPVVEIEGKIEPGDASRFWTKTCMLAKATVSFRSRGGSTSDGIQIGEMIKRKNFATVVPDGALCTSACAVAWLGGAKRFVGANAKIGFHAACVGRPVLAGSDPQGDPCQHSSTGANLAEESGFGNAMLAAYVRKIGLPDSAHFYITKAPHESITWLNYNDAREQGIDFTRVDFPFTNPNPHLPAEAKARADFLKDRATEFINSLFETWSKPNNLAVPALARLYSNQVSYYGSVRTAQAVLLDKQKSAERWPEREYKLRPNSLTVKCDLETLTCRLDGIVTWKVRSSERQASATGETSFVYTLFSGGVGSGSTSATETGGGTTAGRADRGGDVRYEPFSILEETSVDLPEGDVPRYPSASCEPMPLFFALGASGFSGIEQPTPISASGETRLSARTEPHSR